MNTVLYVGVISFRDVHLVANNIIGQDSSVKDTIIVCTWSDYPVRLRMHPSWTRPQNLDAHGHHTRCFTVDLC